MSRPSCSDCQSRDIEWMSALSLGFRVLPADRESLMQALDYCGPDAVAWLCSACGAWGVFGPVEVAL